MRRQKSTSKAEPRVVELNLNDLKTLALRAQIEQFEPGDGPVVTLVIAAYVEMLRLVEQQETTLARLRRMLFGARTEKTNDVLPEAPEADAPRDADRTVDPTAEGAGDSNPTRDSDDATRDSDDALRDRDDSTRDSTDEPPSASPGHGRNGASAYSGAARISIPHETLEPGDPCPACGDGKVYDTGRPGVLIRLVGQAPVQATVYELQKLRCHLCGKVFTARRPDDAGSEKYDATSGSMIALLKYGSGLPFNRVRRLQGSVGVPLPAATQWDLVHAKAKRIAPAFDELIRQAAQGDVIYNDDTSSKILEFMGERARKAARQKGETESPSDQGKGKKQKQRTGMFTTGIVAHCAERQIAIFVTGRQHCGENLGDVLRQRAQELKPPIQMCDALARNIPKELQTILANCLAHGRRYFVDVVKSFRNECRYVLDALKVIYKNDAEARQQQLSPEERLLFHQAHSSPVMDELHCWLKRQFDERLVEPNSGLGEAITYMLNHWEKLTLFLRKAGAPLDNNVAERALKKAILHRKNSYFYRTQNGARVGDLYMSLIYTCELNGVNPFDYLTELERHADELAAHPERWMPWNYRATLESLGECLPTDSASVPFDSRTDIRTPQLC